MNKQELQNKIEDLEKQFNKQISELKEEINSIKFGGIKNNIRFRADRNMPYYFINNEGMVSMGVEQHRPLDDFRYNSGNYFETDEQAKDFRENILTKQALKDLALELNNGVEIDWKNTRQDKWSIFLDNDDNHLAPLDVIKSQLLGQIYCLDLGFVQQAKDRIGEEKLIKLIKSGV